MIFILLREQPELINGRSDMFINNKLSLFVTAVFLTLLTISSPANSFELRGFAHVNFLQSTESQKDQGAFGLGELNFFISEKVDDRTDILIEFVIEPQTGKRDYEIEIERLQLGYIVSDTFKLRVGRSHNILGFWNTEYHHGVQFQTSIERPLFLKFEHDGGTIPVHVVGLWGSGRYNTGTLNLTYDVMLSNGSKVQDGIIDPNNFTDDTHNKAVSMRLATESNKVPGFKVGISGNYAMVKGYTTGTTTEVFSVKQQITAFDLTYFKKPVEFIGEYYIFNAENDMVSGKNYSSGFFYTQAGYMIKENLIPYARFENIAMDENSPYLKALSTANPVLNNSRRTIAGVRYNFSHVNCIKAEVRFIDNDAIADFNEYALQWAVSF